MKDRVVLERHKYKVCAQVHAVGASARRTCSGGSMDLGASGSLVSAPSPSICGPLALYLYGPITSICVSTVGPYSPEWVYQRFSF